MLTAVATEQTTAQPVLPRPSASGADDGSPATVAPVEAERLLTPGQARTMLGVSHPTLVRWADSGRLPSVRTPGGQRRFRTAAVEELRTAIGRPAVEPPPRAPHPPIIRGRRRPLLSAGQVALIVDATPRTVRRWTAAGALPATRTPGGHYRWRPDDVTRFVAEYGLAEPRHPTVPAAPHDAPAQSTRGLRRCPGEDRART